MSSKHKCIIVNLFGVPSSGKSTGAAYIFSKLKMAGINAELVTEFVKELVWEDSKILRNPNNQIYIFSNQFYALNRCKDSVDVIVSDSPLPLAILYNHSDILGERLNDIIMDCFNSFDNVSFLLLRDKPYQSAGRLQTEEESDSLYEPLKYLLKTNNIEYVELPGNEESYDKIVELVLEKVNDSKRICE